MQFGTKQLGGRYFKESIQNTQWCILPLKDVIVAFLCFFDGRHGDIITGDIGIDKNPKEENYYEKFQITSIFC